MSIKIKILIIGLIVFLFIWQESPTAQTKVLTAKTRYVVDGDSLYLEGYKPQIRLWGVDAPERKERGFKAATNELKRLVTGRNLACHVVDVDRYRRSVARCFLPNGQEVNRSMIESGTATEYLRFTNGYYSIQLR